MSEKSMFAGKNWYKGNLHCHTTVSDGRSTPEELVEKYKREGYDFLSITDHEKCVTHQELSENTFLILPGIESGVSAITEYEVKYLGVLGVADDSLNEISDFDLPEVKMERWNDNAYDQFDMLNKKLISKNMITFYHDPVFGSMLPWEMDKVSGLTGMEIDNAAVTDSCGSVVYRPAIWDLLLESGRRILGFGNDDYHIPVNPRSVWMMVKAEELSRQAIMRSIKNRSFYVTRGPQIYDFGIRDGVAYVDCSEVVEIRFVAYAQGAFLRNDESKLTHGEYRLKGMEKYLRVEITDAKGNKAWSQPFWSDEVRKVEGV